MEKLIEELGNALLGGAIVGSCNGWCSPHAPATHIGEKGYIYCAVCTVRRKASGSERCRRMAAWERRLIGEGKPLPSYKRGRMPKEVQS